MLLTADKEITNQICLSVAPPVDLSRSVQGGFDMLAIYWIVATAVLRHTDS